MQRGAKGTVGMAFIPAPDSWLVAVRPRWHRAGGPRISQTSSGDTICILFRGRQLRMYEDTRVRVLIGAIFSLVFRSIEVFLQVSFAASFACLRTIDDPMCVAFL